MRNLIIVAFALAIVDITAGAAIPDDDCSTFDPAEECSKHDFNRNFDYYEINPCNCTEYYHCDKVRGRVTAYKQTCYSPCQCFSSKTWTCSETRDAPSCPTEAPVTEAIGASRDLCYRAGVGRDTGLYIINYQEAYDEDRYISYYWLLEGGILKMPCAPGTFFSLQDCGCISCHLRSDPRIPCATGSNNVFCFDFDGDGAEKGISYDFDAQCKTVSGPGIDGSALQLDGEKCSVEVPFFQNNEFRTFTLTAQINRFSSGSTGEQGVIFNGNGPNTDCWPASIYVISVDPSHLKAGIVTDIDTFEIVHTQQIVADQFNEFYLRYDGSTLDFVVGGVKLSIDAQGVTKSTKCPLLIGESFDSDGNSRFFDGLLDKFCFYSSAIKLPGES